MLKRLEQPTLDESWIRTNAPDSTIIFEKFDFKLLEKFENIWYQESLEAEDEHFCPDCGEIGKCDSAVYLLEKSYN